MKAIGWLSFLLGCVLIAVPVIKGIVFDINCESYLKSAADAPTIKLAKAEMDTALEYLRDADKTHGHSHLIIKKRQADVGYWYERLKTAREDLDTVAEGATPLEVSNVLMKLREVILDEDSSVTVPPHIATFPNQWGWTLAVIFGVLMAGIPTIAVLAKNS